jgi:hypothetical protein
MEFVYCVEHEYSVPLQHSQVGDCHERPTFNEFGCLEYDVCFFEMGYTYCDMPEVREDWDEDESPSPEELELIEEEAEYIWE